MESIPYINEFFLCEICDGTAFPPLNGCINGHFVCHYCKYNLDKEICPVCRSEIKRQIGMERLLNDSNAKVDCPNKGCNVSTTYEDGFMHSISCEFRPLFCLLSGGESCSVEGPIPIENFEKHIIEKHPEYAVGKVWDPVSNSITITFDEKDDIQDGITFFKRFDVNGKPYFLSVLCHSEGYYTMWVISYPPIPIEEPIKHYTFEISPDSDLSSDKTMLFKGLHVLSIRFQDSDLMEEYGKWAMIPKNFFPEKNKFSIHIKTYF